MIEWFSTYWPAMLAGLMFGTLFLLVREFLRRFAFSAVLFLIAYKVLVNNFGHDHQLAGSVMLGIFAGCLVHPGVSEIARRINGAR